MSNSEKYILALDQGTTSSRAIIFNEAGMPIGKHQLTFNQIYPQPGWVEHDPLEIWHTQFEAAKGAIAAAQIRPEQIAGIGITNQRETTIVWSKATGQPVHNAIVWQCRRSALICQDLKAMGYEAEIRKRTGLVLDPYFSGTKLAWLFENISGLRGKAERGDLLFGTVDSWLMYKLTGRHVTDATNASRTLLFNIHEGRWDDAILRMMNIPASILPTVLPSSGDFGYTKKDLFDVEIPVTGCAGDQQAALFGHACFQPGASKNTYGTGCFALMNTGSVPVESHHNLLTTIAWDLGNGFTYALEGSVFIAGAVVQWLRDEMLILADSAESERLARSVPDTGGVVLVPAFVGMGAPYWDPDARGGVLGITRGTSRAHFVRAALEAVAYQSRDLLVAMEHDSGARIPFIKADGGASANSFLMQFQSDIIDKPVILPEVGEVTALGAAYLAGLRVGYWKSLDDVEQNWRRKREFTPEMARETRNRLVQRWDKAVNVVRSFS
ncbi:MAG: glycerol kinase [Spirochaetes bacterium GWD1_61_31]|nr:MAG: glycerol kinase [Spirochaetes bacterium GWB1_60_80]OHD34276.1 MAG: glycerol kinase [Spirochaetes bacterium GWC1_61_12]OHD40204.1 MAG: glycerol kinase [Spirochaetes bacterium GWD1_61_31]OHD45748.1 MAG: glycerol kinase [Spirochaetes bacterium GWE1_60_18]OHD58293.1 MAG: glycerol kinase [Spirochaetes bacterium GWF1_60_12]HAX37334.1 glycerol kinase [Spirochaetaceae bacterium]